MWPRLLLTINRKFAVDFFARGLHTRTAVARLPLHQLGFLVILTDYFFWSYASLGAESELLGIVGRRLFIGQMSFCHPVSSIKALRDVVIE